MDRMLEEHMPISDERLPAPPPSTPLSSIISCE